MHEKRHSFDRGQIEQLCREHGISLTSQRRTVLETLPALNHPTVDDVWFAVRTTLPEVSRTTVYRILENFTELRIIRKVCHPGAVARYEERTDRHHHLLCVRCGAMTDMDDATLDRIEIPGQDSGFTIEDYSIQFRGICHDCSAKSHIPTSPN